MGLMLAPPSLRWSAFAALLLSAAGLLGVGCALSTGSDTGEATTSSASHGSTSGGHGGSIAVGSSSASGATSATGSGGAGGAAGSGGAGGAGSSSVTSSSVASSSAQSSSAQSSSSQAASSASSSSSSSSSASSSSAQSSSSSGGGQPTGVSCDDIYKNHGAPPSGTYTLHPGGAAAFTAYCDMVTSGADEGGWTLVLKADGTKSTFAYTAAAWTGTPLFGSPDLGMQEMLSAAYTSVKATSVRVGFFDGTNATSLTLPAVTGTATPLHDLVAGATSTTTNLGVGPWKALLPSADLQDNRCEEGLDVAKTGATFKVRIGITADNATSCGSGENSFIGVGSSSTPSVGGACQQHCSDVNSAAPTVFAYVAVR